MPDTTPNNQELTIHCKNCKGVLFKNVNIKDMQGKISLHTRCPHCQKDAQVDIEMNLTSSAKIK